MRIKKKHLQRLGLIAIILAAAALLWPYLPFSRQNASPQAPELSVQDNFQAEKNKAHVESITDVAPPQRAVDAVARDLSEMELPPAQQPEVVYPPDYDPANPPKWTEALAAPDANPTPPDPFTTPPVRVDPRRVKNKDEGDQ